MVLGDGRDPLFRSDSAADPFHNTQGSHVNVNEPMPSIQAAVEEQVQEEEAKLAIVRRNLEKSTQLTSEMTKILDSFESRLADLMGVMMPIHKTTTSLTRAHDNIDATLITIGEVLDNLAVADEVEDRIMAGPHGDFGTYLHLVDRVHAATEFLSLEGRSFKTAERSLVQLRALAAKALPECELEFAKLISRNHSPVDPARVPYPLGSFQIDLYPPNIVTQLKALSQRLAAFERRDYLRTYVETRGRTLRKILEKFLPDKYQSGDDDGAVKSTSTKGKKAEKKAAKAARYEKSSHRFISCMVIFCHVLTAERALCKALTTVRDFDLTFGAVIEEALSLFIATGEGIVKRKRTDRTFLLLDLLENLNVYSHDLNSVIQVNDGKHNDNVNKLVWTISTAIQKAFREVSEDLKAHPAKEIPEDGTVHQLTSNTLQYLRRLFEYKSTVESLLPPPPAGTMSDTGSGSADSCSSIAFYIQGVLAALESNLETKSKSYKTASLTWIFLLNNYQHLVHTVRNSELHSFLGHQFTVKYDTLIRKARDEYKMATWAKTLTYLVDDAQKQGERFTDVAAGKGEQGALVKSQRHAIKARYNHFNSEFADLYHKQKNYSIPDPELRDQVRQDCIDLVVPVYTQFYNSFGDVKFSKNRGKYVKYAPQTLEVMLKKFFSQEL